MKLLPDRSDPLPDYIFGGMPTNDFLDQHLNQVTHPLLAGFGLLSDNDSTMNSAWSVQDVSNSFYRQVEQLTQAPLAPPLSADPVIMTPRLVTRSLCVRAVQVSNLTRYQDADVQFKTFKNTRVSHFLFSALMSCRSFH